MKENEMKTNNIGTTANTHHTYTNTDFNASVQADLGFPWSTKITRFFSAQVSYKDQPWLVNAFKG